jgi:hypothetical protein
VQVFVGSFVLLILAGTVGFRVLPGLCTGARHGWLDSLFTATSAVCGTGLIVVDTASAFPPLEQASDRVGASLRLAGRSLARPVPEWRTRRS